MSYFYWTDKVDGYESDENNLIVIKRLNFFIGKNNSGKSRFCRALSVEGKDPSQFRVDASLGLSDFHAYFSSEIKRRRIGRVVREGDNPVSLDLRSGLRYVAIRVDFDPNLSCDFMLSEIAVSEMEDKLIDFCEVIKDYLDLENDGWMKSQIKSVRDLTLKKENLLSGKFYVPILRGLRPFSDEENCYSMRTRSDYFSGADVSKFIITGEEVYIFLRSCLLGEPEQRDLIQKYEDLLSQYFFDGQKVTLIPKHDSDVVHIKIGEDKQRAIYELGDGLQQAIILTYQCYLQQDSVCAFFIEEPELHMHAGMLRQLMNFYLNETKHYYFFTTHSNHLLDMVDESDEVVIQKFTKKKKDDGSAYFEIKRCDKDRELLAALGVRPSSVYLANCTIWVEGIADRLYLTKYMQRYLYDLEHSSEGNKAKFLKYRKFMQNFHYTFVEYQGSNLTHWSFDDDDQEEAPEVERKMKALDVCANMLLIADGDIREKERVDDLQHELGNRFVLLESKEIENTLPVSLVFDWAITKFAGAKSKTKEGFDIKNLIEEKDNNEYLQNPNRGIGVLLDDLIREEATPADKSVFAEKSGTIKKKTDFCTDMLAKMGDRTYWDSVRNADKNPDANDQTLWQLTDEARRLCEQIFEFIDEMNQESFGATSHAP